MNYVGIDWAYRRAAWCALDAGGRIEGEGLIPADGDGLARLVLEVGAEVSACVEATSGAVWVKDQLELAGWVVQVAHAGKVRQVAPLACNDLRRERPRRNEPNSTTREPRAKKGGATHALTNRRPSKRKRSPGSWAATS